ncbi:hypothetical protein Vadar_030435 [Vaccinium darrowii]|uniref:Uncharacterized protein n=1 Tax=Vaccinium darrowii TaxID=229202 RepID=A0ACB7Z790_9ERIC|nr:hypothetical protein Vadar_030435 [Vaccinium darrowii]
MLQVHDACARGRCLCHERRPRTNFKRRVSTPPTSSLDVAFRSGIVVPRRTLLWSQKLFFDQTRSCASTKMNGKTSPVGSYTTVIVKHLLWESKIDVNARNGSEWTALDIIYRIKKKEDRKGEDDSKKKEDSIEDGKEDRSTKKEDRKDGYDIIEDVLRNKNAKRRKELFFPFEASWQKKKKETLMIVSSLIATIAFQVGVYPPGGVWVDNAPDHVAGKAITAYNYPNAYRYFMYFNTIGFLLSLTTILELIVALPEKHKFMKFIRSMISWMTIMATAFAYTFSVNVISPSDNHEKPITSDAVKIRPTKRLSPRSTVYIWHQLHLQLSENKSEEPSVRLTPIAFAAAEKESEEPSVSLTPVAFTPASFAAVENKWDGPYVFRPRGFPSAYITKESDSESESEEPLPPLPFAPCENESSTV